MQIFKAQDFGGIGHLGVFGIFPCTKNAISILYVLNLIREE